MHMPGIKEEMLEHVEEHNEDNHIILQDGDTYSRSYGHISICKWLILPLKAMMKGWLVIKPINECKKSKGFLPVKTCPCGISESSSAWSILTSSGAWRSESCLTVIATSFNPNTLPLSSAKSASFAASNRHTHVS
jgi:hypothetical protein